MENLATPLAHTPGPWTYSALNPRFEDHAAFRIDGNHMYESVADVFYREGDGEALANARLIAAAPDLRNASQNLYNALQNYLDVPDSKLPAELVEAMDEMEAAWHKADGTEPEPE